MRIREGTHLPLQEKQIYDSAHWAELKKSRVFGRDYVALHAAACIP